MAKKPVQHNTTPVRITTAEARATSIRMSPRKMRLVTNMVKGMPALDAIQQLQFTNKKAAQFVHDLIRSGVANASNNFKLDAESLYVKIITADSGAKLKRYMPRAQGRASEIRRPTCHLYVLLEERPKAKKAKAKFAATKRIDGPVVAETSSTTTDPQNEQSIERSGKAPKSQVGKTPEQRQNSTPIKKRRLFNRKSGV